ncbi:TPA: HNH endonuclease [Burkholderia multivorans]|nr:HNH endonuclease [Burkholderia multivorans]HDR9840159.1 HNH endonuclease [Burkholderia multivorans]HDR9846747.1 HNH endonuclease [Burkholderia multivorans]HDR9853157.1 HNH endonuclease [Burkholderia multivorans]
MEKCKEGNCNNPITARGLCNKHYKRFKRNGTLSRVNREWGSGTIHPITGRIYMHTNGKLKLQHIHIAEKALGKELPNGAQVHHVDENPQNNAPENLVICPDQAYHSLLHQRAAAFDACGHANWRKCRYCQQWDDPDNLYVHPATVYHLHCRRENYRLTKAKRKTP